MLVVSVSFRLLALLTDCDIGRPVFEYRWATLWGARSYLLCHARKSLQVLSQHSPRNLGPRPPHSSRVWAPVSCSGHPPQIQQHITEYLQDRVNQRARFADTPTSYDNTLIYLVNTTHEAHQYFWPAVFEKGSEVKIVPPVTASRKTFQIARPQEQQCEQREVNVARLIAMPGYRGTQRQMNSGVRRTTPHCFLMEDGQSII